MYFGRKLLLWLALQLCAVCVLAQEEVKVEGYHRSDGTYVAPHYRTKADATINNNWTTKGNINPHTGKAGWIDRQRVYSDAMIPSGSVAIPADAFEKIASRPVVLKEVEKSTAASSAVVIVSLGILVYLFVVKPIVWVLGIKKRFSDDKGYVEKKVRKAKSSINHELKTVMIALALSVLLFGGMALTAFLSS